MDIDIDKLTVDELVALNHRIVQRLKMLESLDAHKAMMEFNLGTRVSFDSPKDGRFAQYTLSRKNCRTKLGHFGGYGASTGSMVRRAEARPELRRYRRRYL